MSFSSPKPPDPVKTIDAQTQSNIQTATENAALNRINQYTPYGSSTYTTSGTDANGIPIYNQSVNLSPQEQQIFNNQTQGQIGLGNTALGMLGQVQNSYQNPLNTSGLPQLQSSVGGNYQDQIKQAQDAAYHGQTQYLDPQYQQGEAQLKTQLANEGLQPGSEAYDNAYKNFQLAKQSAYQGAQNAAVGAGNQEQNTLYGQGLQGAQLNNQALGQGLSQLFALRNQPLNEFNALQTGAQVQNPQFNSVPQAGVQGTDVAGITQAGYQNQLGAFAANQAPWNALLGLGGQLGAAALGAPSDRRLKQDIERIGTTPAGLPVYKFRYRQDPSRDYIGVMADEAKKVFPDAVFAGPNGFDWVDYARIG
jgi:hypothetical protein